MTTYPKSHKIMTNGLMPRIKVYDDSMNDIYYVCDAPHGSLITEAVRRVQKIQKSGWAMEEQWQSTVWYWNAVPDLATVQLLTYY